MKNIVLILCAFALSGCYAAKYRKAEKAALDTVIMDNKAGAVTDSIYSKRSP